MTEEQIQKLNDELSRLHEFSKISRDDSFRTLELLVLNRQAAALENIAEAIRDYRPRSYHTGPG